MYLGKADLLGWKCNTFEFEEAIDEDNYNLHKIWVRYIKSPKASYQPIPVRYEVRGFNAASGTPLDNYHLDYNFYSNDNIPDDIFEVDHGEYSPFI